ncbi:MAG: protease modulator HflC [Myxococcota bacterium]
MRRQVVVLLLLATLGVAASFCVVIIDEREVAFRTILNESDMVLPGLGQLNPGSGDRPAILDQPGWYIRIPFIHQLYRYEKRRMRYDRAEPLELQTSEKLLIEVDYYAVWRIADPELYFKSIRTRDAALRRLDTVTYSAVQQTLAGHTLAELLSEGREEITRLITKTSAEGLAPDGIEILDLRIRRTVYPEANLAQIYNRMRSERNRFAMRFRAEGEEQSRGIRSKADRESLVIRSTAERDSARLRGDGDAEATRIYAEAFAQDLEFYEFIRSLEAYRLALNNQTTLILSPDAPFLRYLFEPAPGGTATPR